MNVRLNYSIMYCSSNKNSKVKIIVEVDGDIFIIMLRIYNIDTRLQFSNYRN